MSMSCDNMSTREIVARNVGGDPRGRPKRSHILPLLFASVDASWATLVVALWNTTSRRSL